jgi:translation initiation factor IF-2
MPRPSCAALFAACTVWRDAGPAAPRATSAPPFKTSCSSLCPAGRCLSLLPPRSPPGTAGQQDRGKSAGPGFPDLDGSGRTGGGPPPDHAGPQADVAGLPDPDAGPRPDAAGRGAGRRTTSPGPGRIPAGTAGPGPVLGQGRAAPRAVVLGGVGGIHPSLLAGSRVRGGGGSPAAGGNYGRARPARIPRGTPRRAMQSFEYRSVRYWSKEINGTLTGGRKK